MEQRMASESSIDRVAAARELLHSIARDHPPAVFACSFGAEDMVLVDLIARDALPIDVFTLDTGRLPEETHALVDRVRDHYEIGVDVYFPERAAIQVLVERHGVNGFYRSVEIRKACRGFVAATQAIGEPCSMRDAAEGQCKSDMGPVACVPTDQSGAAGVCAAFSHGRAGDSCDASCKANGCEFWFVATRAPVGCFESDGLACSDANTDSKKCQPISKRGQPCFLGTCGAGDVCGTSAPTTSNTTLCMAPALLGEYCGGGCAEGLACIGLTCQPDTLGADSRSCDNRINE